MGGHAMDITKSMGVHDANAGKGILQGRVDAVPIDCGSVKTYANVFVGSHVPFDLLLGRPWQHGNFVSIDECDDGTYLLFKRRTTQGELLVQYEICVEPEDISEEWANSISSFIYAANSFSVTSGSNFKFPGSFPLSVTPLLDGCFEESSFRNETDLPASLDLFLQIYLCFKSIFCIEAFGILAALSFVLCAFISIILMPILTRAMSRSASQAIGDLLSIPHIVNDTGEFILVGTPVSDHSNSDMELGYPDDEASSTHSSMPSLTTPPEDKSEPAGEQVQKEGSEEIQEMEKAEFYQSFTMRAKNKFFSATIHRLLSELQLENLIGTHTHVEPGNLLERQFPFAITNSLSIAHHICQTIDLVAKPAPSEIPSYSPIGQNHKSSHTLVNHSSPKSPAAFVFNYYKIHEVHFRGMSRAQRDKTFSPSFWSNNCFPTSKMQNRPHGLDAESIKLHFSMHQALFTFRIGVSISEILPNLYIFPILSIIHSAY
ncbi:hypothetical protein VKT23_020281 [Stygiomarasmius scandens]|uniref:Uncharacterized protein n=1 Tax=Marasmiellus scandens TaxID=2682957 RepID=A0ABR1IJD0_9AGAR